MEGRFVTGEGSTKAVKYEMIMANYGVANMVQEAIEQLVCNHDSTQRISSE